MFRVTELANTLLSKYVGGQLEIQNQHEGYLYRGEIEKVWIEGEGGETEVKVRFAWLGKLDHRRGVWENQENLDYSASLLIASISDIGEGRLSMYLNFVYEQCVFFPSDGSKLDPAKVEGLVLTR